MPLVIKMAHDYQSRPDFQVIGISLPFDPLPAVQTYAAEKGMNFTVAYDGGKPPPRLSARRFTRLPSSSTKKAKS